VSGAREYGELYMREASVIAGNAAAKQSKQLDHVFGADDIRVSRDEQGGRCLFLLSVGSYSLS